MSPFGGRMAATTRGLVGQSPDLFFSFCVSFNLTDSFLLCRSGFDSNRQNIFTSMDDCFNRSAFLTRNLSPMFESQRHRTQRSSHRPQRTPNVSPCRLATLSTQSFAEASTDLLTN